MVKESSKLDVNGIQVSTQRVTPSLAKRWLERHNTHNRQVDDGTVDQYVRAIQEENWYFVGDPIRFATDNTLLDGQHRLTAVVITGVTIPFVIIRGLDPATQLVMDQNKRRSAANQLGLLGIPDANNTSAIANMLLRWHSGDLIRQDLKLSNPEINEFVEAHRKEMELAVTYSRRVNSAIKAKTSVMGAAFFKGMEASDEATAIEFFEGLAYGYNLGPDSPIGSLRNSLMRAHTPRFHRTSLPRLTELWYTCRAWNWWRKGKPLTRMQLPARKDGFSMSQFTME